MWNLWNGYLDRDALHEKCPNTELFLVSIFLYLCWIRRFTKWISVFNPNKGKCEPEKTPYLGTFHAVVDLAVRGIQSVDLIRSRPRLRSYRNQSIDLQSKSMEWFLNYIGLGRERVNKRHYKDLGVYFS